MAPSLEKLRRFALATGLVLITYSLAVVELSAGETVRPLGVPLKINRPEWLGVGLALASLWGFSWFLYFGVWKAESPRRKRNALARRMKQSEPPRFHDQSQVEELVDNFRAHYPRLPGLAITASTEPVPIAIKKSRQGSEDQTAGLKAGILVRKIRIPWAFRLAAWMEDAYYFAPIWLNAVALLLWIYRVFVAF